MKRKSNKKTWTCVISLPFCGGKLGIRTSENNEFIDEINFCFEEEPLKSPPSSNALAVKAVGEIEQYLTSKGTFTFSLPLAEKKASEHQKKVWQAMCATQAGKTITYGEIAKQIGSAPRAVGAACGSNHFSIVVPCHRIVSGTFARASDGTLSGLGGFCGVTDPDCYYLSLKRKLLEMEHQGAAAPEKRGDKRAVPPEPQNGQASPPKRARVGTGAK